MKFINSFFGILSIFSFSSTLVFCQGLNLTFNPSATMMVNNLISTGIITSGYTGNFTQYNAATFTNGNNINLGFESGIIISTGILNVPAYQASMLLSTSLNQPGDSLLDQISAVQTLDAQSISFDFAVGSDSAEFNFIFASEEYNEFVNTIWNDVFGFFISGPGYTNNTNIALLPGTSTPISTSTINNGGPFPGVSSGPCINCNYYRDNLSSINPAQLAFDGFTTLIKIKFKVWPCSIYNLRLSIADGGGSLYDSAILFEENSFKATAPMAILVNGVPAPPVIEICAGGSLTLTMPEAGSYNWSIGDTTQSIIITQPGIYECMVLNSNCFVFAQVQVNQVGIIQTPVIVQSGITLSAPNLLSSPGITYQWSFNGTPILGAVNPVLNIQGNGCYMLTIYEGTCESASNILCITNTSSNEIFSTGFTIVPHPVTEFSSIKNPFAGKGESTLKLFDISGKIVREQSNIFSNEIEINFGLLKDGIYFLELINSINSESLKGKVVFLRKNQN